MKTNLKTLRLAAVAFALFALPFNALADSFDLYLCGTGTAGLIPDGTVTPTLKANDQLIWQEFNAAGTAPIGSATLITVLTDGVAPPLTITGLAVGGHYYKVHVVTSSPTSCSGDVSPIFNVYSLPAPGVALAAPTTAFCEANSNTGLGSSVITATATALDPLLSDVGYVFTWTATKDATAVDDVTKIGDIAAITTPVNVNTFTLNNTAGKGAYVFKASVTYKVSAGTLRSGTNAGCVAESAASPTITVTPKPATPTIVIAQQ